MHFDKNFDMNVYFKTHIQYKKKFAIIIWSSETKLNLYKYNVVKISWFLFLIHFNSKPNLRQHISSSQCIQKRQIQPGDATGGVAQ